MELHERLDLLLFREKESEFPVLDQNLINELKKLIVSGSNFFIDLSPDNLIDNEIELADYIYVGLTKHDSQFETCFKKIILEIYKKGIEL